MAIKTFTTGEVLTASDTNTYLANSGLVTIATKSATSGTTLNMDGCFTSTYTNYLVTVENVALASTAGVNFALLASTSLNAANWTWGAARFDYGASSLSYDKGTASATGPLILVAGSGTSATARIDLFQPQTAANATMHSHGLDSRGTSGYLPILTSGILGNTTQYDGLRITAGATISSMTVTVYGYRKG